MHDCVISWCLRKHGDFHAVESRLRRSPCSDTRSIQIFLGQPSRNNRYYISAKSVAAMSVRAVPRVLVIGKPSVLTITG